MKLSKRWLSDFVEIDDLDAAKLGSILTMTTAEVEEVVAWGAGLGEIRVGRVLEVAPHENADRLRVAKVDVGGEEHTIVCGAPNCEADIVVPVALPGSRLPDGTKIKKAKIRGVASAGMLCSPKELGLGEDHGGLMLLDAGAETGAALPDLLPLEDVVIDIDNKSLTHRPDLWGHYGFAREIAAKTGRVLRPLDVVDLMAGDGGIPVRIEATDACARYIALAIEGLAIQPSPGWMQSRLTAVGLRPISNIVDFTNYVMLEIGQPMHAFDLDRVGGGEIRVRMAAKGESIETLDGVARQLTTETLVIADREKPVAIAGVMGGADSEISDATKTMILESANFDAVTVRRTANRLGLRTDAATRFEKSLDPEFARLAVLRFAKLCETLVPDARIATTYTDAYAGPPEPITIEIRPEKIRRRLGMNIPDDTIRGTFEALEFRVEAQGETMLVGVPSFRATKDIGIEEDLVEEVGRFFGYDNIDEAPLRMVCTPPPRDPMRRLEDDIRDALAGGLGFDEVAMYSFVSDDAARDFDPPGTEYRVLRNPIAQNLSRMRRSLVPELLGILPQNLRTFDDLRVFEIGHVYAPKSGSEPARESRELCLVVAGRPLGKKASREETERAFRTAQGVALALLERLGVAARLEAGAGDRFGDVPWAHPTRIGRISQGEHPLGCVTQLHPAAQKKLKLEAEVALAVVDLDAVTAADREERTYRPIPRFPSSSRDLAVIVPESVTVREVESTIRSEEHPLIEAVRFFDLYRGAPIADGSKSLAFEIVYQAADRTLRDDEVDAVHDAIVRRIEGAGWEIRR